MLRIHFTPEDLLHISFAEQPAPLAELGTALITVLGHDPHPDFLRWRRELGRTMSQQVRPLLELISPRGAGPRFLDPPCPTLEEAVEHVLATPEAEVRSELNRMCAIDRPYTPWLRQLADRDRDAWQTLVAALRTGYHTVLAETWPSLHAGFHADLRWRAHLLTHHGLHAMFASLSPTLHWHGTTLCAEHPRELDVTPAGRGIILQPTLTWAGHLLSDTHPDGRPILIYPALTPLPQLETTPATNPLRALLGNTRADALRLLTHSHTTTDLARTLGITAAAASMQTKALRDAGLISSRRNGRRCTTAAPGSAWISSPPARAANAFPPAPPPPTIARAPAPLCESDRNHPNATRHFPATQFSPGFNRCTHPTEHATIHPDGVSQWFRPDATPLSATPRRPRHAGSASPASRGHAPRPVGDAARVPPLTNRKIGPA